MTQSFDLDHYICVTGVPSSECSTKLQEAYVIASIAIWFLLFCCGLKLMYKTFHVPKDGITPRLNQRLFFATFLIVALIRIFIFVAALFDFKEDHFYVFSDALVESTWALLFNVIFYSWTATTHRISYKTFHVWWMQYKRILWTFLIVAFLVTYLLLRLFLPHDVLTNFIAFQCVYLACLIIPSVLFYITIRKLKAMISSTIDEPSQQPSPLTSSPNLHSSIFPPHQSAYFSSSPSDLSSQFSTGKHGPFTGLDSDLGRTTSNDFSRTLSSRYNTISSELPREEPMNKDKAKIVSRLNRLTAIYTVILLSIIVGISFSIWRYGRFFYLFSHFISIVLFFYYQPENILLLEQASPDVPNTPDSTYSQPAHSNMIHQSDDIYLPPSFPDQNSKKNRPQFEEFDSTTPSLHTATQSVLQNAQQQIYKQHLYQTAPGVQGSSHVNPNQPITPVLYQSAHQYPPQIVSPAALAMNSPVPGGAFTKMTSGAGKAQQIMLPGQSPSLSMGVGASLVESYLAQSQGSSLRSSTLTNQSAPTNEESTTSSTHHINQPQSTTKSAAYGSSVTSNPQSIPQSPNLPSSYRQPQTQHHHHGPPPHPSHQHHISSQTFLHSSQPQAIPTHQPNQPHSLHQPSTINAASYLPHANQPTLTPSTQQNSFSLANTTASIPVSSYQPLGSINAPPNVQPNSMNQRATSPQITRTNTPVTQSPQLPHNPQAQPPPVSSFSQYYSTQQQKQSFTPASSQIQPPPSPARGKSGSFSQQPGSGPSQPVNAISFVHSGSGVGGGLAGAMNQTSLTRQGSNQQQQQQQQQQPLSQGGQKRKTKK